MLTRRLLLNLSKAMLELSLLTRDYFVKWQDDKESSQVKVRIFVPNVAHTWASFLCHLA